METQEIVLNDFSKGMIEIIELGVSADRNYTAPSLKYLENLNPNILQGALLKRRSVSTFDLGTDSSYVTKSGDSIFGSSTSLDFGSKKYCGVYGTHKWQLMPNGDHVEADTGKILTNNDIKHWNGSFRHLKGPDVFLGMDRFDMRNPVASSVYFALFRDDQKINGEWIKSSSVNGYYYSKNLDPVNQPDLVEGVDWWNPLYDYATVDYKGYPIKYIPFSIKGGRINGIVQDWVVVGQAVYFVSLPDKSVEQIPASPVYRWSPILSKEVPEFDPIFLRGDAKRSYYLIQSDTSFKVKSSSIEAEWANVNQTQTKETIDWDKVKDSVDVLWWQTNEIPDMADIDEPVWQMIGHSDVPTQSSNRQKQIETNYLNIVDMSRLYGNSRMVPAYNNIFERIILDNPKSNVDKQQRAVSEYYCVYLPRPRDPKYIDQYTMFDGTELEAIVTSEELLNSKLAAVNYHTQTAPFQWGWTMSSRDILELCKPRPVEYGTDLNPQLAADKQAWLKVRLELTYGFRVSRNIYFEPRYFRYIYDEPEYVYLLMPDGSEVKRRWDEYPLKCDYQYDLFMLGLPKMYVIGFNFDWFMPSTVQELLASDNFVKSRVLDYETAGAPRPWSAGEEIPYALTAVVDGIEVLLLQDSYIVQDSDPDALYTGPTTYRNTKIYIDGHLDIGDKLVKTNGAISLHNFHAGTHHMPNPFICFTLRFNMPFDTFMSTYLPLGTTSFRLYVSYPDYETSASFNTINNAPYTALIKSYTLPEVEAKESRAYGLVKEFLVQPNEALQKEGTRTHFKEFTTGSQGNESLAHGKWSKFPISGLPADNIDVKQITHQGGSGYYYIPYMGTSFTLRPTPDFYLWDYSVGPNIGENLGLLSVAWDGIGARCITQVSNRVVIAGTIDKDNSEEVGRIRAAVVQGVSVGNTIFAELDALDVCSTPIEALANFRNDLWIFSHNSIVRVTPANPYDMTTWQIVDTITGQGILDKKHLVQTPMGLFFANSSGIWFVDGSKMENVVLPVQQTFKFVFNQTSDWQAYHRYSLSLWKVLDTTSNGSYNDTFELNYNAEHNELVASVRVSRPSGGLTGAPGAFSELSLIYNIDGENFRVEVTDLPVSNLDNTYMHSSHNKTKFLDHDGKLSSPFVIDRTRLYWRKGNIGQYDEHYLSYIYDYCDYTMTPKIDMLLRNEGRIQRMWYPGIATFYEIGNGLDDSLLRQVLLEITPMEFETGITTQGPVPQITWRDPKLYIQYRNKESKMGDQPQILQAVPFPTLAGMYDLVELNTRNVPMTDIFWSHVNTPIARVWSRESMVLNTPLDAKFRRLEATLVTTSLSYLKSLRFKFSIFKRKTLG